ncbi:MAG: efflux RND transporter permease subunit [Lachnospiraceae bacterium]|nr:efflux RND transporter permease subunit [Lachnospiraceae bacterium]
MDSALVKVTSAINTVRTVFPEEVGIPNVLELSADMIASMYLAISYEGKDIEELSRFVEDTLLPQIERQDGVADVSATGLIEKTVQVSLNQKKVDELNEKIKAKAQDALDDARASLDDAKKQLEDGQAELDKSKKEMADGQAKIDSGKAELEKGKEELEKQQKETYEQLAQASLALDQLSSYQSQLVTQQAQEAVLKTAIEEAGKALAAYGISVDDLDSTVSTMETGLATATNSISTMDQLITLADAIAADPTLATQDSTTVPGQTNGQVLGLGLATLATAIPDLATLSTGYNAAYAAYALDTSNETAKDAYVGAVTASSGALTTAKAATQVQVDTINASLPQLKTAQQTINSYKSELTALEVEIEVTKGIVAKFEEELKKLGVSYTDIEAAKMQAAAGFAAAQAQLANGASALETAQAQLDAGKTQMDSAKEQLESGWESYNDAEKTFEDQSKTALESANADGLLSLDTISALIYAQNFEMPAGYIDDKDDNSWLLKIGNNYDSVEDLGNMLLASIDGIGDITLDSVADITVIDNSGTTYARLNNQSAVILSVYKASTTGTNEVSRTLRSEIKELEDRYEGLDILVMVDQGDYIEIIIKSVMQSMILGAALAVIILAFFLKDVMPTIVVAISIPLSVLLSLVAMYFSGISLNMMSLSGMALGIGMLVDNSIVIIENIYRLRGRGINAPRAAVQGTNQVAGAVVASTLTSVCVFFPMVYTTGMVRSLMLPMALTIIYCLLASLLVAMTVVPAASSTLLRKTKPKSHKFFDKIQNLYGKVLAFCLKVKVVPLAVAVLLLGISVWQVFRMGIVMIPELTSNQIQATVSFDEEELSREEAYGLVDELIYRTVEVPGVASVGSMSGSGEALFGFGGGDGAYNSFSLMISTENERAGAGEVKKITDSIYDIAKELGIDVSVSGGLDEMGAILGSGLSISIYGQDLETLRKISEDLMEIVSQVDGYVDISNGQEEADKVLRLDVDKDKAIKYGVTVAQIYQAVAAEMATTKNAITVTVDGVDMKVDIVDELDPVTAENLLDIAIPVTPPEEKSEDDDKETKTEIKSLSLTQASTQETRPLSEFATLSFEDGYNSISRENQTRYITVTAGVAEGENETLLSRKLRPLLDKYEVPDGYTIDMGGESEATMKMVKDMMPIFLMGIAFIYFVMVAQFQSLLSPFIVLFTLPLAYTGGFMSLWFTGENISMMALMGFIVLTGTVVNNGIVYVDYTNQLRMGGMERRDALIATGKTRMRPILMTALTTILAEASLIFGDDMGSQMGRAMALVIAGGLLYATLMTLFIIPVMYDILFKKPPLNVDVGGDNIDDIPDDAKEFMLQIEAEKAEKALSKEE